MKIQLTDNDMLVVNLTHKAMARLSEYMLVHPLADENDPMYYAKLDTVRFFQAQLAESVLNAVNDGITVDAETNDASA